MAGFSRTPFIYILLVFFVFLVNLSAGTEDTLKQYGISFQYISNTHIAGFGEFEGIPTCCPEFNDGSGSGISIGAFMNWPLPYNLSIGLKLNYSILNGDLRKDQQINVNIDDQVYPGAFGHFMNTGISDLGLDSYLSYRVYKGLKAHLGVHAGVYTTKKYDYLEKIVDPSDRGVFIPEGTRTRNASAGEIPETSSVYGAMFLGASYELPLNKESSLMLAPEIYYYIGLSNVLSEDDWKLNSLRIGASLIWAPIPPEPEDIRVFASNEIVDTVEIRVEELERPYVKPGQVLVDSSEYRNRDTIFLTEILRRTDTAYTRAGLNAALDVNTGDISIKTQFVSEAFPVLPVVFFDENSSVISDYYTTIPPDNGFEIENIKTDLIIFHRNVLNIIGKRLTKKPKAKLFIRGTADSITEGSNCALAGKRARSVRDYLRKVWNIDKGRLRIEMGTPPCKPRNETVTRNDSGYAENRRVELRSNDPDILKPIHRKRFIEIIGIEPNEMVISFDGTSNVGIDEWTLVGRQDGEDIFSGKGKGRPEEYKLKVDRALVDRLQSGTPLSVELYLSDDMGRTAMARKKIIINKDTNDIEIERMSIVLFDVGSDLLSREAKSSIRSFTKHLDENSSVRITGYTDALGSRDDNIRLSQNRAKNAGAEIRKAAPKANILEVTGVGSSRKPAGIVEYDTPSARFLSRSVQIEIINKIK